MIDTDNERLQPIDPLVQRVHQLINEHRTSIGLSALTYNEVIAQQAKNTVKIWRVGFSHNGFDQRKEEIDETVL